MADPLVVVGAGGFGRETLDVVDAINGAAAEPVWSVLGVLDDAPSEANLKRLARREVAYLGTVDEFLHRPAAANYVVGVGSPRARRVIADKCDAAGLAAATLIHPATTLGFDVQVGKGSVICAGARLTTNIRLGRHVHLNPNVTVGHDTTLGEFVSMNPASALSGECVVEADALIGAGGVVLNQLRVGQGSTVGAAACVVRDVPSGVTVKGVPAR
jgi:sugar O-acyltransferase (sialic acid O-acetyltransferase NeuD family)